MRLKTISAHIDRSVGGRGDYTSLSFKVALDDTLDRLDLKTGEVARSPNSYIYSKLKDPNPELFVSLSRAGGGRAPIDEGIGRIGTVHYAKAWNGEEDFFPSSINFRLYLSDED